MTRARFYKTVKYKGKVYPAGTVFEINEKDIEDIRAAGGKVAEEKKVKLEEEDTAEEVILEEVKENKAVKKTKKA